MSQPLTYECPFCHAEVSVPADNVGTAVACTDCGRSFKATLPSGRLVSDRSSSESRRDDADAGIERDLLAVRPAVFRANPVWTVLMIAFAIGGGVLLAGGTPELQLAGGALILIVLFSLTKSILTAKSTLMTVTNRRTVLSRGILSKSTSEVSHSDLRNIKCDQSLLERTFGFGDIALSSSGQDDMEIVVNDIPNPHGVLDVIRRHR